MSSIRKRNDRYQVQVRRRKYTPASKTFTSRTAAKKWIQVTEADMERGSYAPPPSVIVCEILKRYQQDILPTHKGADVERYRLRRLNKHFGAIRLTDLTPKEIAKYRDIRLKAVSPASLKRELKILSRILAIASKDWGIALPQNPVTMISLPKADKVRTRRLEVGEEEQLLQTANQKLRRIIILALETGMPRGEILNIKRSHIDFQKSVLLIPSTKTDQPRTIPLSTDAVTVLREQLRASQSGYEGVIPLHESTVFDYHPRGLSGEFLKLCRRKGIHDLRFHDLRHEATSRLFEKGLNPVEVATITGQKDTRMLMRYTHLRAEDLVERLG